MRALKKKSSTVTTKREHWQQKLFFRLTVIFLKNIFVLCLNEGIPQPWCIIHNELRLAIALFRTPLMKDSDVKEFLDG